MGALELECGQLGRRLEQVQVAGARVNRAIYAAGFTTPEHVHSHGNLCVTLAGRFAETWGNLTVEFDAQRALVKPPGVEHVDRFGPSDVTCINIDFTPEAWEELTGNAFDVPRVLVDPKITRLARELELELIAPDRMSALAAEGLVLSLVVAALRVDERTSQRDSARWLEDVLERLHNSYATTLRLDELAASVDVRPTHLTRRFRARFGCSIGDYVRRLRVAAALRGLAELHRSLADVAIDVGFSDQSHMGRVLRRETGLTPGAWRARMRPGRGPDRSSPTESF